MKLAPVAALLLAVAGCATPTVPETLRPAAGERATRTVHAQGVQIYECRTAKDDAQRAEWAFVAPEARLFDDDGRTLGKHYAGPHWEANDGSKVVGSVKARANAPKEGTIPWLLLSTQSDGPTGAFATVTSIQRINTAGGAAPGAAMCTRDAVGRIARVAYTADYVFFVRE